MKLYTTFILFATFFSAFILQAEAFCIAQKISNVSFDAIFGRPYTKFYWTLGLDPVVPFCSKNEFMPAGLSENQRIVVFRTNNIIKRWTVPYEGNFGLVPSSDNLFDIVQCQDSNCTEIIQ